MTDTFPATHDTPTFILCPICHNKTRTKVLADSILLNYPLFCPKCKGTCIVDVSERKLTQFHALT